ncbi:MAG: FecR family protein [Opitutaceae bacterium]
MSRHPSIVVSQPVQRILPDGSMADLKSDADIAVDFSGPDRRVELKRGEAHFQIAKDLSRPFVVMAGGVEVRAVGTAFSVDLGRQAIEIFVTEGRVRIVAPPSSPPEAESSTAPAFVDAGNRAVVAVAPAAEHTGLKVSPVSETELSERLSWRVPRLEFAGTPLSEAIPMFNKHSARWQGARIVLGDSDLGRLQLSGILRADNTTTLLRVLATEFGIKAELGESDVIVLRKN